MSAMVSFLCCPFLPRDVLNEILNLIESDSEGVPTYSYLQGVEIKIGNLSRVYPLIYLGILRYR